MADTVEYSKDGRRRIPLGACEFDHRFQSMECPSCAQAVHGITDENTNPAWWDWYRKRYNRRAKRSA